MDQPLVIAYHLTWTAYGWWLPNDPRGGGSETVRCDVLAELGEIHFGRKKVQPCRHVVREFYQRAAVALKHPLLIFDEAARRTVADAFGEAITSNRYTCYACAVMPDHVHLLLRKHKHTAEEMIANLQERSGLLLRSRGQRSVPHPIWTGGSGWKVFLDHPKEVWRTITYIERNPLKLGLPAQPWEFVKKYDNWPLHPGHSPNSPYAVRLRKVGRYP